tara:strand:- start:740 stop:1468 length:729 start_codon:yes stop_codon:yes gene_type:complete
VAVYNKEFTVKNGLIVENNNSVKLSTGTGTLRYVSIKAPNALTGDYELTFPIDDGAADEMLITDGSGTLAWGKVNTINMFANSVTPVILEDTGDFTMNTLLANRVKSTGDMVLDPNNDDGVTGVVEIKGDLVVRGSNNIAAGASFAVETGDFTAQVAGRYLVDTNTNTNDITVVLPTSPNIGNTITFADMKNSWDAYNVILDAGTGKTFQDKTGDLDSPYILDVAGVEVLIVWTGTLWKVYA